MSLKPLVELPLAPSRTRTVQSLSLALWAIPVLAASFKLAVWPSGADTLGHPAVAGYVAQSAQTDVRSAPGPASPVTGLISGGATIPPAFRFVAATGAKHEDRVHETVSRTRHNAPTRTTFFSDVKIIDANHIEAGGATITLANVAPPDDGSMCKRIDGVVESCAQRAASRLAVLTQGRRVKCTIWNSTADSQLMGHCSADRLDIASDLIRLGLARPNPWAAAGL